MKSSIRKKNIEKLNTLSDTTVKSNSKIINNRLIQFIQDKHIRYIGLYSPIEKEVDISDLSNHKMIKVYKPRYDMIKKIYEFSLFLINDHQNIGRYNIPEPKGEIINTNKLELIIVPGIGFDLNGNRLGRGKGYYDKLLTSYNGIKIGVCHDIQITDTIPVRKYDQKMNYLCTETKFLKF